MSASPKVSPGQPLRIGATTWNRLLDIEQASRPAGKPGDKAADLSRPGSDLEPWFPVFTGSHTVTLWPGTINGETPTIATVPLTDDPVPELELEDTFDPGEFGIIYARVAVSGTGAVTSVAIETAKAIPTPGAGEVMVTLHKYAPFGTGLRMFRFRSTSLDLYMANGAWRLRRA